MTVIVRVACRGVLAAISCLLLASAHAAGAGVSSDASSAVIFDGSNNMVVMGGRVGPSRAIAGNFAAAGGSVVIDQPIGKNAAVAGGSVEVQAPVGHNFAAAGGTVTIDAPVGGNLGIAGGEIRIGKDAVIGGRAKTLGSKVVIDGIVDGDLHAVGESLKINGEVHGDVDADVETIELGPQAKVLGKLQYVATAELKQDPGATVGKGISRLDGSAMPHDVAREKATGAIVTAVTIIGTVMMFLVVLAGGAIFISVAPIFSVEAPDRVRASPLSSIGMGLLTIVGAPIIAVLFMVTIIGIPVGVMLLALYPLALLLGFVVGMLWLANLLPQILRKPPAPTVARAIAYFALALVAVMVIGKVPVIGGLLIGLLLIAGVGAFEVELYRRMRAGSGLYRRGVEVVRP